MEAVVAFKLIHKVFKTKDWIDKDIGEAAFDGFCNLFAELEASERELILELVEKYVWISQDEYRDKLIEALENGSPDEIASISRIYFFPIKNPDDELEVKSGDHLLYSIKSFQSLIKKYKGVEFKFVTRFEQLQKIEFKPTERLFLIDDYIGSGTTLMNCLVAVRKNTTITALHIKIVCIAIQEEVRYDLVIDNLPVLSAIVVKKGITDYNAPEDSNRKKTLMRKIESNIPGAKPFSLGFMETEALITMMRTPDNTFPVFWKKFKKGSKQFDAPFKRDE